MVQHVAGIANDLGAHIANERLAAVNFYARRVLWSHPAPDIGVSRLDPQDWRRDLGPAGGDFFDAVQNRTGNLVRRIAKDVPLPFCVLRSPMSGQEIRAFVGHARVILLQARGDIGLSRIGPHRWWRTQLIQPLCIAARRVRRFGGGQAKAFEIDQFCNPLRPHARIDRRDIAAHRMTQQVHRLILRIMIKQRIEVAEVVRKPVAIAIDTLGQPEAAPVRGDHMPVALQAIDDELEGCSHIHPAMQHENPRCTLAPPVTNMGAQLAQRDEFGTGGFDGDAHRLRSSRWRSCRPAGRQAYNLAQRAQTIARRL